MGFIFESLGGKFDTKKIFFSFSPPNFLLFVKKPKLLGFRFLTESWALLTQIDFDSGEGDAHSCFVGRHCSLGEKPVKYLAIKIKLIYKYKLMSTLSIWKIKMLHLWVWSGKGAHRERGNWGTEWFERKTLGSFINFKARRDHYDLPFWLCT